MKSRLSLDDLHCIKVNSPVLMLASVFGLDNRCLVVPSRLFISGVLPKTGKRIPNTDPGRDKLVSGVLRKVIARVGKDSEVWLARTPVLPTYLFTPGVNVGMPTRSL
jgi:hypothetical protein